MKKIAYLALYPAQTAPSQRFRVEQYLAYWEQQGVAVSIYPFYSTRTYRVLYQQGRLFQKAFFLLADFLRRLSLLPKLSGYDAVFIQRAAVPIGPPVVEWLLKKWLRKPLIYDFDDAIWIPDPETGRLGRLVKSYAKTAQLCALADQIVVGNDYLAQYARRYGGNVRVIPTVVDTEKRYVPGESGVAQASVVIGWTGSHSTLRYLRVIAKALQQQDGGKFIFRVVANRRPEFLPVPFEFIPWSEENEIAVLRTFDIGIMPLIEDSWSLGKCGFKAIQYMALGIPAVVTPVGVNQEIVDHGTNGYHAESTADWVKYLNRLVVDPSLRMDMGMTARKKIERDYSLRSALPGWREVFDSI